MEILDGLSDINHKVWTSGIWTEAPDLLGIIWIPLVVINKISESDLWILLGSDLIVLNSLRELISKWLGLHEDSVMLVWRF